MVPRPDLIILSYIAYAVRKCVAGQGMVFDVSVLNRVYNLVCLSTGYFLHDWFDLPHEFCLFSKLTKAMTITWISTFVLNRVIKMEGVVLNRVSILGIFCPKQGQGFKPWLAEIWQLRNMFQPMCPIFRFHVDLALKKSQMSSAGHKIPTFLFHP